MLKIIVRATFVVLLALSAIGVYEIQGGIDHMRAQKVEELGYLPKGEYLKMVALGYDPLLCDFIWLEAIQVMGDRKIPPKGAEWIYNALDVATDLDKKDEYVYEAGGIFLSAVAGDYQASNRILKKGFYNIPDNWKLPFYIGTNYFLYLNNYKQAAYYIGRAAVLPGRPEFVPLLATRLYVESDDPRFAIELIEGIYKQTKDEKVKSALLEREKELVVEENIKLIGQASARYSAKTHKNPESLEALVKAGYLGGIPRDPLGGRYYIDPATGQVKNDKLVKGLGIFKKGPE